MYIVRVASKPCMSVYFVPGVQNSGLRKVKQAQQVAERARNRGGSSWLEVETDSVSMATTSAMGGITHVSRRLESHLRSSNE